MLKLYGTDWSPFVRKVRIASIERNIHKNIEFVQAHIGVAEKTLKIMETELINYNPSGRVPTLITEKGDYIYDSTVIVHYLDGIGKEKKIVPDDINEKIQSLKMNAVVDEVIDFLRHLSFENRREENIRLPDWIESLDSKIKRGIETVENNLDLLSNKTADVLNLGDVSTIILIGSIRRNSRSPYNIFSDDLNNWYNEMNDRKSVSETIPPSL